MANIIELRQKRAKAVADARAFLDVAEKENRAMTPEEQRSYDTAFADAQKLKGQIDNEERQLALEKELGDQQPENRDDKGGETPEAKAGTAFRSFLRGGSSEQYIQEMRAINMTVQAQAGYLVAPQQFGNQLIKELDNLLFMRSKGTSYQLEGAQTLGFPKRTARAAGAAWGAEIDEASEDSTLAFGKREFKPNYMTDLIKVSRPLLQHSTMDPEQIVLNELTFDMQETQEEAYMTGNGTAKPLGIFVASANGISTGRDVSTAASTAIDADALYDLKYSLKAQYRTGAEWVMHRDAVKQASKLKDTTGQYLWSASLQTGQPDRLMGYGVNESEYAPNTFTAGQYVAILGNLKFYWIVDSLLIELQRLVEKYATTNQVGFLLRAQTDGMPVVEEAFARLKLKA
jgi:HK97 family phage major capsid protein